MSKVEAVLAKGDPHYSLVVVKVLGIGYYPPGMPSMEISKNTVWYSMRCSCGEELIVSQVRLQYKKQCNKCSAEDRKQQGRSRWYGLAEGMDFTRYKWIHPYHPVRPVEIQ